MPWAIAATLAGPGKQVVSVSGDGGFLFAAIERGRVRVPTLQKALTEDGVSILDVTVDYSRSVDLAATLVEDRSYEHRPGSAGSSVGGNAPMSTDARDTFRHWTRRMLFHHHRMERSPEAVGEVYQTSTMAALLDGIYDGEMTVAELLTHGDFGLGTFNHLDGEMVGLHGTCHHLRSDGCASVAAGEERTPFAAVTYFRPQTVLSVSTPTSRADIVRLVDDAIGTANLIQAIWIEGTFNHVRTRTVMAQSPPYQPMTTATADDITEFKNMPGDLVGFRTPEFEQGISVAGYHLHFLNETWNRGGHALDFKLVSTSSELHLTCPARRCFSRQNCPRKILLSRSIGPREASRHGWRKQSTLEVR
jgi:acetolactate decarboxylase